MEMTEPTDWQVWNIIGNPIHSGTEDDVKRFVEQQYPRIDLSVISPSGEEFILEGGSWVLI